MFVSVSHCQRLLSFVRSRHSEFESNFSFILIWYLRGSWGHILYGDLFGRTWCYKEGRIRFEIGKRVLFFTIHNLVVPRSPSRSVQWKGTGPCLFVNSHRQPV